MLYLSSRFHDLALLSLRNGGRIGTVISPIINPHNLHIDGFYCKLQNSSNEGVLLDIAVRDISARGLIINDPSDVSSPDELVRLAPVLAIGYELAGKHVIANKKKLGKIVDYAIDTTGLYVQKLYVQPPIWQTLSQHQLTFDRSTIIEITDKSVIVRGPEAPVQAEETDSLQPLLRPYSSSANAILTKE